MQPVDYALVAAVIALGVAWLRAESENYAARKELRAERRRRAKETRRGV